MKNVLLIGMNFYSYENAIVQRLKTLGYRVYHFADHWSVINTLFPSLQNLSEQEVLLYQKKIIRQVADVKFDFVIVIVGRFLTEYFFEKIKTKNPQARFILYLWDDIHRVQNFKKISGFFDDIYSFDPNDAVRYGFHFLPLFYREKKDDPRAMEKNNFTYDIFSAMVCHSDRETIARQLMLKYYDYRICVFLTLGPKMIFALGPNGVVKRIRRNSFNTINNSKIFYRYVADPIRDDELYKNMCQSRAILDIQYPSQIGLTMRSFDTMCVGRKMITTNASIRFYNFYCENNICIIDRKNPEIPKEFLESPYEKVDDEIISSYSLNNWIAVLLGEKSECYLKKDNPYNI